MIDRKKLFKELDDGRIFPAYLLMGQDEGGKEDFILLLQEKLFVDEEERKIHTTIYYPDDCSFEAVYETLMTPSFFSTKNLVIIKDIERITFLPKLLEEVTLNDSILVLTTKKFSINKKVMNLIDEIGRVSRFWEMFETTGISWIKNELKGMGIEAEEDAISYIVEISGTGIYELRNQLWIIQNYLSEGEVLTLEKAREILSIMSRYSIFDLCRYLFVSDSHKIGEVYNYLLNQGVDPVRILYFISAEIKKILKAYSMQVSGANFNQISEALGFKKKDKNRMSFILRNINIRYIKKLYRRLSELDTLLKSNPKELSKVYLEGFLLKLSK